MKFKNNELILKLVFCAIMASFAICLDKFLSFKTYNLKFTLYGLPLMFVGIMYGWKAGLFSGAITGIVLQLTSEYGISITSPFWALAPMAWGFFSGLVSDLFKKQLNVFSISIAVVASSVTSFIFNTLTMFLDSLFYKDSYYTASVILTGVPTRLLSMVILCPVYILVLTVLYKTLKKTMIDKNNENNEQDLETK